MPSTAIDFTLLNGRKAPREVRQQQLIDATIRVLARKGYAALTVADVAREAGLSVGIISFHFDSKDRLLAETLKFLTDQYYENWNTALTRAADDPASKLLSLIHSDFDPQAFSSDVLAAWVAFWGEAQGRPVYDQIYAGHERERTAATHRFVALLNADGGYGYDAELTARGIEAMLDGLWLAIVTNAPRVPYEESAAQGRLIGENLLKTFFPKHFPITAI